MGRPIIINREPPKSWWSGDPRVEEFMPRVNEALIRVGLEGDKKTDAYNRCYEAVYEAIKKYSPSTPAQGGLGEERLCEWEQHLDGRERPIYKTTCKVKRFYPYLDLIRCGYKFCPYCGGKIVDMDNIGQAPIPTTRLRAEAKESK